MPVAGSNSKRTNGEDDGGGFGNEDDDGGFGGGVAENAETQPNANVAKTRYRKGNDDTIVLIAAVVEDLPLLVVCIQLGTIISHIQVKGCYTLKSFKF